MANTNGSNVNITFDGLLCFDLDRDRKLCKIEVHTAAEGHIMKIIAKSTDGTIIRKVLSQEKLKDLSPIHLFVANENGTALSPSVSDSGNFDKILDLASEHFYGRKCEVTDKQYDCSIWLQNGMIGAGQLEKCLRVKKGKEKEKDLFQALKYDWECKQEWEGFRRGIQLIDPEAIKEFPSTFARDVTATITLAAGQSLRMENMKTGDDIFEGKMVSGSNYDITIEYTDAILPTGLFDCLGFAHHCEALKLDNKDPIYGIFRPAKFKDEADTQLNTATEPACCDCCRNDGSSSANLLEEFEEFQRLFPPAAQPETPRLSRTPSKANK